MQNKVITITKYKTKKISLSQLVKAIENINVDDIPLNEKNHTLIGKVFNKFNSLKKSIKLLIKSCNNFTENVEL